MKRTVLAAAIAASALLASGGSTQAQSAKGCADLAIVAVTQVAEIPYNAPLGREEMGFSWTVRNVGRAPYVSADENKQWLSLEIPRATRSMGVHVLPPSGSGPVTIAPGATLTGYIRGAYPAVLPAAMPVTLKLNFAPGVSSPALDCSAKNNARTVRFRRP